MINPAAMGDPANVKIDLSGEMAGAPEKRGFQKLYQQLRTESATALVMGFLSTRKPWTQFVATDNFKAPLNPARLSRRMFRNIEYFQANYLFVFFGLFAYCLITTPLLLLTIVGTFFGYRKLTSGPNTWKVAGWELTRTQQYTAVAAVSLLVCWLVGAGAVLFWLLGATVTVVALHAGFYDSEALLAAQDPEAFPMIEQV